MTDRPAHEPEMTAAPATPTADVPIPAKRGISLEWKLPLLISALVLTIVVAATAAAYETVASAAELGAAERMRRAANGFADLIDRATSIRAADMARLGEDPVIRGVRDGGTAPSDVLAAKIREFFPADTPSVLFVFGTDGSVRAASAPQFTDDELLPARALFANPTPGALHTSSFYERGDSILYWSAVPLVENGMLQGWLAQRRRVSSSPRIEAQLAEILGGDATLYLLPEDTDYWVTLSGVRREVPADLRETEHGLWAYERAGVPQLAAHAEIAGLSYGIIVEQPRDRAFSAPTVMLRRMSVVALLLLVAGAAGAWLVSRHVTAPLGELTNAAEALARGEARSVHLRRADEIGTLGATFNLMAARVRDSHARLRREYTESQALADQLATSNEELLRAQHEVIRAAERTERLQRVTAALSGALTIEEVARTVVEQGVAALGASAGSVSLMDDQQNELRILRALGYPEELIDKYRRMPLDAPLPLTECVRTTTPVYVEGPTSLRERYPLLATALTPRSSGCWVALPLVVDERAIGALGFNLPHADAIPPEDRTFMLALAQQCAQALDRARLYVAEQEARHEAESANAAKSAFLATMSHELRTPLNAIAGYVELLALEVRGPVSDAQRKDLARIRTNQQHLLTLINDVLHFAKLNAGQMLHDIRPVRVHAMLSELEDLIAPQIAARGLRYLLRDCSGETRALADREKLQQIVLNLISNAVKYTERGGSVDVWCECAPDPLPGSPNGASPVRIHVRDSGVGIPPDRLDAIFDPFVQVDRRLTSVQEGIGLGLAISRELARGMGGDITVHSELGMGSTFTVTLPGRSPAVEPVEA